MVGRGGVIHHAATGALRSAARHSAAASTVMIFLTPTCLTLGPRPARHSPYSQEREMRCISQNSAIVKAQRAPSRAGLCSSDISLCSCVLGCVLANTWAKTVVKAILAIPPHAICGAINAAH